MKPTHERSLLRWYPREWRERYGAEMLAMIEDNLGGRSPGRRLRGQLMLCGIKERLRRGGYLGSDRDAGDRCRAGQVLVLVGWAALVVSGAMFAKTTEHWRDHIPAHGRHVAGAAYLVVEMAAAMGAAAVVAGVAAAVPALSRAVAGGRWTSMRRPIRLAAGMTVVTAAATAGLAIWAHRLDALQRNGGSHPYTGAFLGWGLLVVATIASWTRAGVRVERQLDPTPRLLRGEWLAAGLTGVATLGVTAGIVTWWVAVAQQSSSWETLDMGSVAAVATIGTAATLAGGQRLASAARAGLWQPTRPT